VVLTLSNLPNAVVVPSRAVQTGQKGQYVYIVKPDQSVEVQSVTTGISIEEEIVIDQGLSPGQSVVTDGQLRLTSGAKVVIKSGLTEQGPPRP